MIIDYKLTYPSGTATAVLINGFHTPKGDKMARYHSELRIQNNELKEFNIIFICTILYRKQVVGFTKFFGGSFLWAFSSGFIRVRALVASHISPRLG